RARDALPEVRRHLEHADVAVRSAAADAVVSLKATGLSRELAAAYARSMGEDDLEARLSIVSALALQKDRAAYDALRAAAERDPVRAVRVKAAAALKAAGQPAPDPGREAVARPFSDYLEAMSPYDPPPGLALYTPRALVHT